MNLRGLSDEEVTEVVEKAKRVVRTFDELNCNNRVELMGARGLVLKQSVEELRRLLLSYGVDPYAPRRQNGSPGNQPGPTTELTLR